MKNFQKSIIGICLTGLMFSCNNGNTEVTTSENEASEYIAEVREDHAPDKRVALFDVESIEKEGNYVLRGQSNLPEAVNQLKERLRKADIEFTDSIRMLPARELEDKIHAVVKNSVANIRSNPGHSAELATQATLGTPLKVFDKNDNWYLVQTPDGYLSWVDSGGISLMNDRELQEWKTSEKVIFLEPFGHAYEQANTGAQTISDVVAGNIFEVKGQQNGFYEVKYPDGRIAYLEETKARPYRDWLNSLDQTKESFVETSKKLMGLPYLWGGTSSKGVDCSGYTKTVFFLNGMVIPRDASQQIHTGIVVDSTRNFKNLQQGDLLFFGKPATETSKERVIHVGMWIGDNKFIHSMGDVHISNMDSTAADFDEYNYNRYLRTKRLIGQEDPKLVQLKQADLFINSEEVSSVN